MLLLKHYKNLKLSPQIIKNTKKVMNYEVVLKGIFQDERQNSYFDNYISDLLIWTNYKCYKSLKTKYKKRSKIH